MNVVLQSVCVRGQSAEVHAGLCLRVHASRRLQAEGAACVCVLWSPDLIVNRVEQRRLLWRRSNNFSEHMDLMQGGSSKIRTAARPTHDGTHIADDAVPGLEKRSRGV